MLYQILLYKCAFTNTNTHKCAYINTHTHQHTYTRTHTPTDTHTNTHAHIHTHPHTNKCTCTNTNTHKCAYINMHTHTNTHADTNACVKKELGIEVSRQTIHRLLRPKRTGTTTSKRFKSLIMPVFHQRIILGKSDYTCISITRVLKLTLLMKWLHCVKRGHYGCQSTTKIKLMLALLLLVADARYGHFVFNRMHQHISIMIFHTGIVI